VDTAVRGELPDDPRLHALCAFAVKLTRDPSSIGQMDIDALRPHGLDDAAIHDAIQVIAYFNYINRVADAVGIEDEPEWAATERGGPGPGERG
jgi:uncharacterized peroxidase-related enzyme